MTRLMRLRERMRRAQLKKTNLQLCTSNSKYRIWRKTSLNKSQMTKKTINAYSSALAGLAVHMDTDEVILTEHTGDHAEAVDAFLSRRAPRFRGA